MNFYRKGIPIILLLLSFSVQAFAANLVMNEKDLRNANLWQKTMVQAELTDSGKEKIKELNGSIGKEIELNIKGGKINLILKTPINETLQLGPFTETQAKEVVHHINVN